MSDNKIKNRYASAVIVYKTFTNKPPGQTNRLG